MTADMESHGVFNHVVLLVCGLVLLYATIESLGVGFINTAAQCDLQLSPFEKGMINAAAFIGILSTAIFWGYLSDRYGRRAVMLPTIAAGALISATSSLSDSFWLLFVQRFLTGCLVSASSATVYAYLGEMHTDARRSSAIAFGSTFIAFTFIVLSVLAWVILPGTWLFYLGSIRIVPWRTFIWSWCTPGLLAAAIMVFLPESPRYLYSAKGQLEALPVLAKIYVWNHRGKKVEDFPIKSIHLVSATSSQRGFCKGFANLGQLFRHPLRRCVLISHFSMFMVFLLSSGLYTWMPFILSEMLDHIQQSRSLCYVMVNKYKADQLADKSELCNMSRMNSLVYPVTMAMGIICSVTYIAIGFIMRRWNKTWIYCSVLVACSLMLLTSALVPQPILATILLIVGLSSGCAASVLAAITVEVFPTSVRALALCTLYMAGRSGAAVGANLLGLGLQNHCVLVFCCVTLVSAGSTLLMLLWPDPNAVRKTMEGRGFAY